MSCTKNCNIVDAGGICVCYTCGWDDWLGHPEPNNNKLQTDNMQTEPAIQQNKRILKLHHPTGHPYWQKNEYRVQLPDGKLFDIMPLFDRNGNHGGFEIFVEEGNVFFVQCCSGSGFGKKRHPNVQKIIDKSDYDELQYIGIPLVMSDHLINDLKENGIS